jgi:hypothetical protein
MIWAITHPFAATIKMGRIIWDLWDEKYLLRNSLKTGFMQDCATKFYKLYSKRGIDEHIVYTLPVKEYEDEENKTGPYKLGEKKESVVMQTRYNEDFGSQLQFFDAKVWNEMLATDDDVVVSTYTLPGTEQTRQLRKPYTVKGIKSEIEECAETRTKIIWDDIEQNGPGDNVLAMIWNNAKTIGSFTTWITDKQNFKTFKDAFLEKNAVEVLQLQNKMTDADESTLKTLKFTSDDDGFIKGGQ